MPYVDIILSQPPKGGGFIPLKEKIGHLLVFLGCHGIVQQPDDFNQGQLRDVATVDYIDLDDGQGGIIKWGAQVDKVGIINKVRGQSTAIMGRLVLGEAKPGRSAPFILEDHTPEDARRFTEAWLPANRQALAGGQQQAQQQAQQQTPAVAAAPAAQQYVSAPAATAAFPGQVLPAAMPQMPQPVAAGAGAQLPQAAQAVTPEALAAIQRMMADGTLPQMPIPGV